MIPHIIHYCWFGGNPLPELAEKCLASWREFFPDYEIKEWNEKNFDVNQIKYTKEAYKQKKYAYVSDYARFKILKEYGGIYFDTDVEIIRSFKDIIDNGNFFGFEVDPDGKTTARAIDLVKQIGKLIAILTISLIAIVALTILAPAENVAAGLLLLGGSNSIITS